MRTVGSGLYECGSNFTSEAFLPLRPVLAEEAIIRDFPFQTAGTLIDGATVTAGDYKHYTHGDENGQTTCSPYS